MRTNHICPKCKHNRILLVANIPDNDGEYGDKPLRVAFAFTGTGFFGGDKTTPVGHLRACVCRRCGYTELYVDEPDKIPIDGRYISELVGPEPEDSPYR
ncbi:MAG: hypothetical protein QM831_28235 [Kofleriaceae bacterium]